MNLCILRIWVLVNFSLNEFCTIIMGDLLLCVEMENMLCTLLKYWETSALALQSILCGLLMEQETLGSVRVHLGYAVIEFFFLVFCFNFPICNDFPVFFFCFMYKKKDQSLQELQRAPVFQAFCICWKVIWRISSRSKLLSAWISYCNLSSENTSF